MDYDLNEFLKECSCCHCGFNKEPKALLLVDIRNMKLDDSFLRPMQYTREGFIARNVTSVCLCRNCHSAFEKTTDSKKVFAIAQSFVPLDFTKLEIDDDDAE